MKKIKESDELKIVEVNVTTKFIKDEVEGFFNDYVADVDVGNND